MICSFCLACSELEDVREHDRRVTEEAETAQRDVGHENKKHDDIITFCFLYRLASNSSK